MNRTQYRYSNWARLGTATYLLVTMWFLLTGVYYVYTTPPETGAAWAGLGTVLGLLAIYATFLSRMQKRLFSVISVSETGIHVHLWQKEIQTLNWLDLREIRSKGKHGAFDVRGGTPEVVVTVYSDLVGIDDLRKVVEKRLARRRSD